MSLPNRHNTPSLGSFLRSNQVVKDLSSSRSALRLPTQQRFFALSAVGSPIRQSFLASHRLGKEHPKSDPSACQQVEKNFLRKSPHAPFALVKKTHLATIGASRKSPSIQHIQPILSRPPANNSQSFHQPFRRASCHPLTQRWVGSCTIGRGFQASPSGTSSTRRPAGNPNKTSLNPRRNVIRQASPAFP